VADGAAELPASVDVIASFRRHADDISEIAREFGSSNVRVAPTGRAIVDVSEGGDYVGDPLG
jgi:hypothetical protein